MTSPARLPTRASSTIDVTLVLRDSLAGEVDYHLTREGRRPARDVNALDEVPCSTWFCPRNHLQAMSPAEVAIGPPAAPPRPPFRIMKGKARGAALGFEVIDAAGRKFLLKPDVAGHRGMASGAEVVGSRIFHAAGYNVPASFALDVNPADRSHAGSGRHLHSLRGGAAPAHRGAPARAAGADRPRPGWPDSRRGRQLAAGQDRGRVRHDRPAGRRSQRPDPARAAPLAAREPPAVRLAGGPGRRLAQHARQLRRGTRPALRPALLHRLRRGPGLVHDARERSPARAGTHRRGGTEPGGAGRAGFLSAAVPAAARELVAARDGAARDRVVHGRGFRSGRIPFGTEGPRPPPDDRSRRLLGRQAGHVVLGRADRRRSSPRPTCRSSRRST